MTRYSHIIAIVLVWQLLLPIYLYNSGCACLTALITAVIFICLLASKRWERNSYSVYSAVAIVVISLSVAAFSGVSLSTHWCEFVRVFWIYALVAYTATSPYPLSIRMPVIIYTLAYVYMIPPGIAPLYIILGALIFAAFMCGIAIRWRFRTRDLTVSYGPAEPPFSLSLATAIVLAVFVNLCRNFADYHSASDIYDIISLTLLTAICFFLILAKDWKKNVLAVAALVLMITAHVLKVIEVVSDNQLVSSLVFVLSVSPVMFHTTAPVFRGMRIVITLYAIYSALNRQCLISALSDSSLQLWQQHSVIIGIDFILTLTLLAMAIHWRRS